MRPSRRASAASSSSSRTDSVSARPPASARYSDGRISSSPALMTSPACVIDCIAAARSSAGAAASGYRIGEPVVKGCERPARVARARASVRAMWRRPDQGRRAPARAVRGVRPQRAARRLLLRDMLAEFPDQPGLAADIYVCEHEGDRIAHDILHRLAERGSRPQPPRHRRRARADRRARRHRRLRRGGRRPARALRRRGADGAGRRRSPRSLVGCRRARSPTACAAAQRRGPRRATWWRSTGSRTRPTGSSARAVASLFVERDRPDDRDPLEGHLRDASSRRSTRARRSPTCSRASR